MRKRGDFSKALGRRRCLMYRNNDSPKVKSKNEKGKMMRRLPVFAVLLLPLAFAACGVRFDMQDQPRYKAYKKSEFFSDNRASRDIPQGAVARGQLPANKAFYTGKVDNPNPNVQVETTTNAAGNTIVASFPNDIAEFS